MQLDFIKRIWKDLDKEHQALQTEILQVLISKLSIVISKLKKLLKEGSDNQAIERQITKIKRGRYVLTKEFLDESIEDLASWQKMFDPS